MFTCLFSLIMTEDATQYCPDQEVIMQDLKVLKLTVSDT